MSGIVLLMSSVVVVQAYHISRAKKEYEEDLQVSDRDKYSDGPVPTMMLITRKGEGREDKKEDRKAARS